MRAENLLKYGDPYRFTCVGIEISTYCNRKCYYCPNSVHETPKEFMSREVFLKALERLKEINYSCIIDYSFYNEPLLDDRLPEFVKLTKEILKKCIIRIFTNGDYLTPELAGELIDSGVSLFTITQHDKNEEVFMKKMRPLLERFPDNIVLNCLHNAAVGNRGGAIEVKNQIAMEKCFTADGNMIITYNGDILLCCNDYHRKHVFGNIMNESIPEIRNKKSFKKIRKDVRKGITRLEICKQCFARESNLTKKDLGSYIKEV